MKFKKLGTVIALVVSALTLTACGTDNQATFIKNNAELAKLSTQTFELKLADLKAISSGDAKAYVPIINGYLSSTKFSGKSMQDGKNAQVNLNLSLAGQEIPLEIVTQDTNTYLKLETLKPILDMYLQYAGVGEVSKGLDLAKIRGKYLDINAISKESGQKTEGVSALTSEDAKKALDKAYQSLGKSDFKKEGSAITLTLSGEKVAKFIKVYLTGLPKETSQSFEDLTKDKEFEKNLSKIIKSIVMTTDMQKKTSNLELNFTGKEVTGFGLDGKVSFQTTYTNAKVTVKISTQANRIDSTNALMQLFSGSAQMN